MWSFITIFLINIGIYGMADLCEWVMYTNLTKTVEI
jgi:hypothetical protein